MMMLKAHIILCITYKFFDQEDTLEECKMMGAMYVQANVGGLNKRIPNLHVSTHQKNSSP